MAKRYTDTKKWRNEWFRTLPLKAKLVWTYLCDECEYHGVWKADFGLASFQLGFTLSLTDLQEWFGEKIHVFDRDKILIVPFFEFQYGDSKDSWSAKANARKKLETLGFSIAENKIQMPTVEDGGGTVPDCPSNVLLKGKVKVKVKNKEIGRENFEKAWVEYSSLAGVTKGAHAFDRFNEQVKDDEAYENLLAAIANYKEFLARPQLRWRQAKTTFAAFLGTKTSGFFWYDYIKPVGHGVVAEVPLDPSYFDPEVSA